MMISLSTFDKHIINVHLHISINLVLEYFINEALIGCTYIFQTKQHYFITVQIFVVDEYCFLLILEGYLDLVISQEEIYEAQEPVT